MSESGTSARGRASLLERLWIYGVGEASASVLCRRREFGLEE